MPFPKAIWAIFIGAANSYRTEFQRDREDPRPSKKSIFSRFKSLERCYFQHGDWLEHIPPIGKGGCNKFFCVCHDIPPVKVQD